MSYLTQPPVYDTRHQPNGEPPGYLDTSQREFPHDSERGYVVDERGYSLDDRGGGYAPAFHGYEGDRDFRPMDQQGFPQEFSGHDRGYGMSDDRYQAGDVSYEAQSGMMFPGRSSEEFMNRDDGYNRPATDRPYAVDPADRPYAVDAADRSYGVDPADRPYGADPMSIHIRDANDHLYTDRNYSDNTPRNYVSNKG